MRSLAQGSAGLPIANGMMSKVPTWTFVAPHAVSVSTFEYLQYPKHAIGFPAARMLLPR